MIYNEFEYVGHAVALDTYHRSMSGTPTAAQTWAAQAMMDVEAETDLGAVAELGYN